MTIMLSQYDHAMPTWDADPVLLRTFLAVRRQGNLTRAAEELFVTQPAVSRRIDRLERSLGLSLFERLGKRRHLTEAGEALSREAASLLGSADRFAEVVRARRSGEEGRLRVGASTTPGLYLLPAVLKAFQEKFPDVDVRYSVENSLHIEEKIVRNDLDMGFVGAHLTHAALRLKPLLEDEVIWYSARSHPLATNGTPPSPRDLASTTCFVRETGSATRRLIDTWLRRSRARLGRTILIGCPEAAKVLVRSGVGVSYMSAFGLAGEGGTGLTRLNIAGAALSRPIYLVTHADKRVSPPMLTFLQLLTESIGGARSRPRRRSQG
jgi:DNA-binding transcriptional LysR family regulator